MIHWESIRLEDINYSSSLQSMFAYDIRFFRVESAAANDVCPNC